MAGSPPDDRQDASTSPPDDGRDPWTAALAIACVVGLVAAGTVVPALAAPLSGDSFDDPLFDQSDGGDGTATAPSELPGSGGPSSSGLGALNPGDRTSVGGSLGGESLRNQSAETHFYVESPEPAYWRTGAYDVYTGEGWEVASGQFLRSARTDGTGSRLTQTVELERPATALPAADEPLDGHPRVGVDVDRPRGGRSTSTPTRG
jgi:hypothetical protein